MKITKRDEGASVPDRFSGDPFRSMFSLRDAMDRLFDESFWSPFPSRDRDRLGEARIMPRIDISETDAEVRIKADAPGIDPDKLSVEVTEDTVSLSGEMEEEKKEEGEHFFRLERQYGSFSRDIILPARVDPDSVDAHCKSGVLTITLKKQEPEKKKKVVVKNEG